MDHAKHRLDLGPATTWRHPRPKPSIGVNMDANEQTITAFLAMLIFALRGGYKENDAKESCDAAVNLLQEIKRRGWTLPQADET